MPRRRPADVMRTRDEVLRRALDLATIEGLDGISLGRLAEASSLSKSGLFAQFGSKEELQLAVVEVAETVFEHRVLAAAESSAAGLERLAALARAWLEHVEHAPSRGGCFFAAASLEMDDRPGRVRDRVAALTGAWLSRLEAEAAEAAGRGQLQADLDAAQLAFEIHAFVQEANWSFQLHGDAAAFRRAARAIRRVLASSCTPAGLGILEQQEGLE